MQKPDANGRVRVYDTVDQKWRDVWPVDANEMIAKGVASWDGPLDALASLAKIALTPGGDGSGQKGEEDPEPYDFTKHTVPELKEFAKAAGIEGADGMKKEKLTEALSNSGFRPQ